MYTITCNIQMYMYIIIYIYIHKQLLQTLNNIIQYMYMYKYNYLEFEGRIFFALLEVVVDVSWFDVKLLQDKITNHQVTLFIKLLLWLELGKGERSNTAGVYWQGGH